MSDSAERLVRYSWCKREFLRWQDRLNTMRARAEDAEEALVGMVANACTVGDHLDTMASATNRGAIAVLVACGRAEWIDAGRTARWVRKEES